MPRKRKTPSSDVRFSEELAEQLIDMDPDNKIKKWIKDMVDKLREDMKAGNNIPKKLIPTYYIRKYNVNNLYRFRHPEGYRSIYSLVVVNEIGVCPIIWEVLSHPEYEKRFGY